MTLDTAGMGNSNDLLTVSGAVTLGGTLALRQTTMPAGTVTLIDGGTGLTGNFASSNEMSTEGLVNGLLISQTLVNDATNFDLQLVTTVMTPPVVEPPVTPPVTPPVVEPPVTPPVTPPVVEPPVDSASSRAASDPTGNSASDSASGRAASNSASDSAGDSAGDSAHDKPV